MILHSQITPEHPQISSDPIIMHLGHIFFSGLAKPFFFLCPNLSQIWTWIQVLESKSWYSDSDGEFDIPKSEFWIANTTTRLLLGCKIQQSSHHKWKQRKQWEQWQLWKWWNYWKQLVQPPTLLIFICSEPWQLALPRRLRCLLERRGESPGCLPPRLRRPGHLEFGWLL